MKRLPLFLLTIAALFSITCDDRGESNILFSPADDLQLGQQMRQQIESDPQQFPLLSQSEYPEAYGHIRRIMSNVLTSDEIIYKSPELNSADVEFLYEDVRIINDDATLNAFCTPGGFICVYTGLIHYLQTEDALAGVIAHEIAHAEFRHSKDRLERQYGLQLLISIALGEGTGAQIAQLAGSLLQLDYSRGDESEADEYSVVFLGTGSSGYACNSASSFFQKLEADGATAQVPTFLSTHPDPGNRVEEINTLAQERGCNTTSLDPQTYADFKASLPPCQGDPCDGTVGNE